MCVPRDAALEVSISCLLFISAVYLQFSITDWTSNMAKGFLQSVTSGSHAGCPREDAQASSPPPKYSYGYYEQPLGQVVNIVDNHKKLDNLAKNEVSNNGATDNSVQVRYFGQHS